MELVEMLQNALGKLLSLLADAEAELINENVE